MKKNLHKNTQHNQLKSNNFKGEVRIIAGLWRGRKLPVLNANGLRPTGDRVKETLFNWLAHDIVDACCLDCFAGSGSLGFEALSRQAKQVIFLEKEKSVATQLKKNLHKLQCQNAQVLHQDSLKFLEQRQNTPLFDVIFLDPPFHFNLVEQAIESLIKNNWLKDQSLIYIETEKNKPLFTPQNWQLLKEKITGQVCYRLYQHHSKTELNA
ncbi:16S rRNA (guanine(966)-N(2))-methyltransferase RsmD [Seminibacterium arietis]|uniref:Ribosomal RNA small subunit methyltransferase D n=1 Tax=Seminibacterium arietis TaxID=1173502 RepID=A0ABW3I702_9PAST